ncbi:MAG TPA: hypothetical protein VGL23_03870 [Chloroflexota bacterium]
MLLLTIYCWFIPEPGPNELSRIDLTFALARRGSVSIDPYAANTIDRAEHAGRYFSDKPLGLPLLAAPVLRLADQALGLGDLGETRVSYVAHLLTAATVALPAALLAPLLALTARRLGASRLGSAAAAAALALGTALLPFATSFYAHATSAALAFLGFALGAGLLLRRWPRAGAAASGLALGLAALVEYPVILVGAVVLALRVARREPVGRQALFLAGGALALAPLPLYNWRAFGAPWRLGYGFVSQDAFGGMQAGFFGLTGPRIEALAEITLGPAGLVSQSPWLLLGPVGLALLWRAGAPAGDSPAASAGQRGAAVAAGAVVGLFLLYNSSYYLPMGGQSSGPRFLLPALPFLALGLAFLPGICWLALGPAALASFGQLLAIAAVEPKTGPGHSDPFWTYWWPRLRDGDVAYSWAELRLGWHGIDALRPLALPLGLGLLLVVGATLGGRLGGWLRRGAAPAGALLIAAIASWALLVAPAGRQGVPSQFRTRVAEAPRQIGVTFGDGIELVGYEGPSEVAPGQVVDLVLYWRARQPVDLNLTAFVHAVGPEGANLGGYDGPPVGAGFPTNLWPPGALVKAAYRLRLAPDAPAPTALRIVAGMYGPGRVGLLPARDRSGRPLDPGPPVLRLALRVPGPADRSQSRASFEGGLELLSWRLPRATRAGGAVEGALRWRAGGRPSRDATVFVQVLGPGEPVAQWDAQPLRGEYPTSLWPAGEVVEDPFILTIKPGTPPGDYPVIAGLYLLPEVRRLPTAGGDRVELGRLRVEP